MTFPGRRDGAPVSLDVGPEALGVDGESLPFVDMDVVDLDGHAATFRLVDGRAVTVTHLAAARDRFVEELLAARARARRAALLATTGDAPLVEVSAKRGEERVTVVVARDAITVEPVNGIPDMVPLSALSALRREGYELTLEVRGGAAVHLRHAGQRTDELCERIERARADLAERTSESYAELDPSLSTLGAPDGWAVDASTAGPAWPALRRAVAGHARAAEVDTLAELAGDRLRLGLKAQRGGSTMPFALAPVGARVAVEATDVDDRATFVFEVGAAEADVDRLNLVLLQTSFRREALSLPDDQLGRWALALRTLPYVRWARERLVARVVHDARWRDAVRTALSG